MVVHDQNKIDSRGNMIELGGQPLTLRTGDLLEGAIEYEQQHVRGAQRIIAAPFQLGEASEVVPQGDLLFSVEIVIPQRGVDRDALVAPDFRFRVPDLPVIDIVPVVNDVTGEADKCRIRLSDGFDQGPPYGRVGGPGIVWVVEPGVSVDHETERSLQIQRKIGCRRLRI